MKNTDRTRRRWVQAATFSALAGATYVGGGVASPACAQVTESVILNFNGGEQSPDTGEYPIAPLIADTSGPGGSLRALYGTGGSSGNVFKLTPPKHGKSAWTDDVLYTFPFPNPNFLPEYPGYGGLYTSAKRIKNTTNLYGTTQFGGINASACPDGERCGSVFSVAGDKLTTLWTFTGGSDGGQPYDGVIADKSGALYTTTVYGGGTSDCGTAIKLTPPAPGQTAWTETTIWTFTNGVDGCYPGGLIIDKSGALYGSTAFAGGAYTGTVFKLIPPAKGQTAWTEQTLWTFQGGNDAAYPNDGMTAGDGGVLYGTTLNGGTTNNGTVFEVIPPPKGKSAWTEEVIWSFSGGSDGSVPYANVIIDKAGNLYSTAATGGAADNGTVFKLAPPGPGQTAWTETTLWSFTGGSDGGTPEASVTADKAGVLYGTTYAGGSIGAGVAFSLTGTGFVPN